jgi:hypothetical protein
MNGPAGHVTVVTKRKWIDGYSERFFKGNRDRCRAIDDHGRHSLDDAISIIRIRRTGFISKKKISTKEIP